MAGKRSVVLGGTINQGNYENLRFEFAVEGIETTEDAVNEAIFAGQCMLSIANLSDEATGQMIRNYVGRTFGLRIEKAPAGPRQEDPSIYESKRPAAPSTPATVTLNRVSPLPERMPPPTAAAPAPVATPTKPAAPTVATCSKCGSGVTESQKKMSQLFMSKTLCKQCMEAP